jgi:hypothetical protein
MGTEEPPPRACILNVDFTEWVESYDVPKFNFLHCDFPYGIDADKRQQGHSVALHGGYEDTKENYFRLLDVLLNNIPRICDDSAHIMFWFSMEYYCETMKRFSQSDFRIDPFPPVWMKSDGKGLLPDPNRGPRRIYETCLFGSRGDRPIVRAKSNAYSAPTDRRYHMSTKPEEVLGHFFQMFVDDSTIMLDPTCGSGTALRAAERLGASVLGLEIDKKFADDAQLWLVAARDSGAGPGL